MTPILIRCANTYCENVVTKIGETCPECKARERMTETPELREKQERIERWRRHKKNRKDGEE